MATLTIRGLDDDIKAQLRVRAAHHGRSMEAEVRAILHESLSVPVEKTHVATRIRQRFAAVGGVDIPLQERTELPRAADLPE
jgi:antitoxin FitA